MLKNFTSKFTGACFIHRKVRLLCFALPVPYLKRQICLFLFYKHRVRAEAWAVEPEPPRLLRNNTAIYSYTPVLCIQIHWICPFRSGSIILAQFVTGSRIMLSILRKKLKIFLKGLFLIDWVPEWWIFVFNFEPFATKLSYFYLCGSVCRIRIRIHKVSE